MEDSSPKGSTQLAVGEIASIVVVCVAAVLVAIIFVRGGNRFTFGTISTEESDRERLVNNYDFNNRDDQA